MESSCNWEDMIPLDSTSRMRGRGQGKTRVEDKTKYENDKCSPKLERVQMLQFTCIAQCAIEEHHDGGLGISALKANKVSRNSSVEVCLFIGKSNEGLEKRFALSSANENLMVIHPDGPHSRVGNVPTLLTGFFFF